MALTAEQTTVIRSSLDPSGFVQGMQAMQAASGATADKIVSDSARVTESQTKTTRAIVDGGGAFERVRRSVDPAYASSVAYAKAQDVIAKAVQNGRIDQEAANKLLDLAATKYRLNAVQVTDLGAAHNQASFAARNLTIQSVQFFSSLQAGMPFMMAAVQQGHQLVDSALASGQGFGALGQAAKSAFGFIISPVGLAVAGLAAVGAAAYVVTNRIVTLQGETRSLNATIAAAGRTADLSSGQLVKYITELERAGVDREEGTSIISGLTRNPMLTQQQQGKIATLAPDIAAFLGTKPEEAAKLIATAFAGGYDAVKKLDDALNFLNPDQRTAIRQALEHGDRVTALGVEVDALDAKFQGFVRAGMSDMDKKLRDLRNRWIDLKDAATEGWGPSNMSFTQIAAAAAGGFRSATLLGGGLGGGANPPGLNDLLPPGATMPDLGGGTGGGSDVRRDRAPGSTPVPGGAAADAQRKKVEDMTEAFRDQQRVLEAGLPAREVLRATIEAENKARDLGLTGAARETYITQAVAAARMQAGDAAAQELLTEQRLTAAGGLWADTLDRGRASLITTQAALEAHEKASTQAGVAEEALAQAIINRRAADEASKGAGAYFDLKDKLTDTLGQGDANAADSRSAHMTEVRIAADNATRSMKAYRDATTDPAVRDALTAIIDKTRGIVFETDAAASRQANYNQILTQRDSLAILKLQGDLLGSNTIATARQVAEMQELLSLQRQQGADPAKLTEEQQKRIALAGTIAAQTVELQNQKNVLNDITGLWTQSFDTISAAMTQAFVGGQGAAVNWRNVMTSVAQQILSQFMKLAVINPLLNSLFPGSEHRTEFGDVWAVLNKTGGAGAGAGTGLFTGLGNLAGGSAWDGMAAGSGLAALDSQAATYALQSIALHSGGIVGRDGTPRSVAASVFAGAPRFHTGLGADEFAAILQRGERVLTAPQQRAVAAAAGQREAPPTIIQNNTFNGLTNVRDGDTFRRSIPQTMNRSAAALSRVTSRA